MSVLLGACVGSGSVEADQGGNSALRSAAVEVDPPAAPVASTAVIGPSSAPGPPTSDPTAAGGGDSLAAPTSTEPSTTTAPTTTSPATSTTVPTTAPTTTTTTTTTAPPGPERVPTPAVAASPVFDGSLLSFRFSPVAHPALVGYEVTVRRGGQVLKQERPPLDPTIFVTSGQLSTPGEYCATARALAAPSSGVEDSPVSAPSCYVVP